jgi:hypothetical protein
MTPAPGDAPRRSAEARGARTGALSRTAAATVTERRRAAVLRPGWGRAVALGVFYRVAVAGGSSWARTSNSSPSATDR